MDAGIRQLCEAGAIAEIARAGHAPFDIDDPIEIRFQSGAVFTIEIGLQHATDVTAQKGELLELAFGHLRTEEPQTYAGIARDWTRERIDLPWAVGRTLSKPRRLAMTHPYHLVVGYVFDCGGRELALFGEADLIYIAAFDDPEIASYALQIV